jgi:hypothetical protein
MKTHQRHVEEPTPTMSMKIFGAANSERRAHRRHDLEGQQIVVQQCNGPRRSGHALGQLVDISTGGVRIRTERAGDLRVDQQIRVRLELPTYAGIFPFVDTTGPKIQPKREWEGWMAVSRVRKINNHLSEVAGRLVDMQEMDKGMLGLYLSTQPLAA